MHSSQSLALMRIFVGLCLLASFIQSGAECTSLYCSTFALAALFTLGLGTRILGPLLTGLYFVLWLSLELPVTDHTFFFVPALALLSLTRSSDHYSADHYLWNFHRAAPEVSKRWVYAARALVPLAYILTFIAHCSGATAIPQILVPMAIISIILSAGLVTPRTRKAFLWIGVIYHLIMQWHLTIDLGVYTPLMLSFYLAYLRPEAGTTVVLYDGNCTLCQRSMRIFKLFDWLQRITWLNFRDAALRAQINGISDDELEQEMFALTASGKKHAGFYAWRAIWLRLPLTLPLAGLLYLPGITQFGRFVYATIAQNRFGLAPCTDASCRIHGLSTQPEYWRETLKSNS